MSSFADRIFRPRQHRYTLTNGATLTVRQSGPDWLVEVRSCLADISDEPVYAKWYPEERDALIDAHAWINGLV